MKFLAIVLMGIAASVLYGVVHDQVTIRVCLEYFTVAHPDIGIQEPTALAFAWGIIASWWAGAAGGLMIGTAARFGARPRIEPGALVRPMAVCLVVMAVVAAAMALTGYLWGESGGLVVGAIYADDVPEVRHSRFLACLWSHWTSYVVGFIGMTTIAVRTWRTRGRLAENA